MPVLEKCYTTLKNVYENLNVFNSGTCLNLEKVNKGNKVGILSREHGALRIL